MKEILTSILPYILEGGFIATVTFLITARQVKRKAKLENDSTSINNEGAIITNLESVIADLRQESANRKEEREQYHADLQTQRFVNDDLREENTAIKMMMCVHMGCRCRKPIMGQGDTWYTAHKAEANLGCDYKSIEELIKIATYGENKSDLEQ